MNNESAAKQTTDLLKSSPTLRNIISPYIKGNDAMHIRIGKTDDPEAIMDTDRSNGDLTMNEKHVDKSGFNFKAHKGDVDNGGYTHLGTVEDTFAASIGHECLHEKHFYWFREARRQITTSSKDCFQAVNFLRSHGFSSEYINIFYSNNGGKWIENPKAQMDKNEHDYIRKYDVDEIRRISKEYRSYLLEFHPGQD